MHDLLCESLEKEKLMSQSKELRVLPSEAEYDYLEDFKLGFIFFSKKNAALGSHLHSSAQKLVN